MIPAPNTPDEAALRRDLASGRFVLGVVGRRWRLISYQWPHVIIAVRAADNVEYGLRFECRNYPQLAVTAQPWDFAADKPLATELWPTGQSRIPLAFNPGWKGGICLYLPCDRLSIEGHEGWRVQHPALLWEPSKGICKYLSIVHQMLNAADYGGRRVAA
jgi:hypothetical protein